MVKKKQIETEVTVIPRIKLKRKLTSSSSSSTISDGSKKAIENFLNNSNEKKIVNTTSKKMKLKKKQKLRKEKNLSKKNKLEKKELNDENKENEADEETSDNSDSDEMENEEEILDEIDLEYSKLQSNQNLKVTKESACSICDMSGFLIDCQGSCQQSFHLDCVGLLIEPKSEYKCEECISDLHPCFLCKKPSSKENNMLTRKCSFSSCGKYYHDECVKKNDLFRKDFSNPNKFTFTCSLHACATCYAENSNSATSPAFKGRLVKCLKCPVAYHHGEYCIAAGSIVLNTNYIICPAHFQPIRPQSKYRVNVNWCFVCCKTGELIGCNQCPAAYHTKCLEDPDDSNTNSDSDTEESKLKKMEPSSPIISKQNSPITQLSPASNHSGSTSVSANTMNSIKSNHIQSNWTCEDCLMGKRPLYGQIVWAKVGNYRWWPAQICLPRCLPDNVRNHPHHVGEFPVKFFGSNDYYWLSIGRCFIFAEGDESNNSSGSNRKTLARAFKTGVRQAKVAFKEVERLKSARNAKTTNNNKFNFQMIKTNKPYGSVIVNKLRIDELPRCDCDPKSASPCGSDQSCLNRMLNNECHPLTCPSGDACLNQRFVKRQYPKQEAFFTGSRGWGLRNLVDIKKGEFVNEYVGELINEEECKRRLVYAHKNNIKNFYYLAIEKDRIIDAGPKGNLARFANHSCEPNMETQKWSVNGDVRVGLFAKVDIPAYTELTFNYNLDCLSNEKAVCRCGAKNCSGFIGERPKNSSNEAKSSKSNTSLKNSSESESNSVNSKKRKLKEKKSRLSMGGNLMKPMIKSSKKRSASLIPSESNNIKEFSKANLDESNKEKMSNRKLK